MLSNSEKHNNKPKPNKNSMFMEIENDSFSLPDELAEIEDIPYRNIPGGQLKTDIIFPKNNDGKLPIAVNVHGGALIFGDHKMERRHRAELAKKGYLVYGLEYRLLNNANGIEEIDDICAGLAFVRKTAAKYGGDIDKVYIMGESAGAFLSLYAAAAANSPKVRKAFGLKNPGIKVRGLACISGMLYTSTSVPLGLVYTKDLYAERCRNEKFMRLTNPEHPVIMNALPPVFLTTSSGDFLRSMTKKYVKALEKSGHPNKFLYYDSKELKHGFPFLAPSLPESREVLTELDKWLRAI